MSNVERRTFVLVHGAWIGGWAWRDVLSRLHGLGHAATGPSLAGIGERRHLGNKTASLETHVEDLVAHAEMEDLRDVTLVGWSYGGMVVGSAIARIADRVRSVIYLDAFVPVDGKPQVEFLAPEVVVAWNAFKERDEPIPPLPLEFLGITDPAMLSHASSRVTDQPWRTLFAPATVQPIPPGIAVSYIRGTDDAPHFDEACERVKLIPGARTMTIDARHVCVMTAPELTARALTSLA